MASTARKKVPTIINYHLPRETAEDQADLFFLLVRKPGAYMVIVAQMAKKSIKRDARQKNLENTIKQCTDIAKQIKSMQEKKINCEN